MTLISEAVAGQHGAVFYVSALRNSGIPSQRRAADREPSRSRLSNPNRLNNRRGGVNYRSSSMT